MQGQAPPAPITPPLPARALSPARVWSADAGGIGLVVRASSTAAELPEVPPRGSDHRDGQGAVPAPSRICSQVCVQDTGHCWGCSFSLRDVYELASQLAFYAFTKSSPSGSSRLHTFRPS